MSSDVVPNDVPGGVPGDRQSVQAPERSAARRWWPLSRAQAFCLHLTLSLLVFSALVILMLTLWFPGKLFVLGGGWQGLKVVVMVDLVLGPALTLLLYKPGKPGLRVDMSLVAALQVAALGYGSLIAWQQRTVAVVFAEGQFSTLSAAAHRSANAELVALDERPRRIRDLAGGSVPVLVNPPPDKGEFGSYLTQLFNGYPEPHERSDRFVSARQASRALSEAALPIDSFDSETRQAIQASLKDRALSLDGVQLHRFKTRYARGVTIFDPTRVRVVDWLQSAPALAAATPAQTE